MHEAYVFGAVNRIKGLTSFTADKREFLKISQAVGVGFLVMGAVVGRTPFPTRKDIAHLACSSGAKAKALTSVVGIPRQAHSHSSQQHISGRRMSRLWLGR